MQLKILALNGSPRKDGNTATLLKLAMLPLTQAGAQAEIIHIAQRPLRGCCACMQCFKHKDGRCHLPEDGLNDIIGKMRSSHAVFIGSPTYFADVTPETKALIDRVGFVSSANGHIFRRMPGAAVVAVRRAGAIHAFDTINHFFGISQMVTVGSSYWNIGIGREPGAVEKDPEGCKTMATLGENMLWLLQTIYGEK